MKRLSKKIFNYLIVIEPDKRIGTNTPCYAGYCPALGLADDGNTIEDVIERMKELIRFHLKVLQKEKQAFPENQKEKSIVTMVQVPYSYR